MTFSSIMITFYPTITGLCHAYFVIFDQNVICCIPENVIIRISRAGLALAQQQGQLIQLRVEEPRRRPEGVLRLQRPAVPDHSHGNTKAHRVIKKSTK